MKILSFNHAPVSLAQLTLKHTLQNGQCFNWQPLNPEKTHYAGVFRQYYVEFKEQEGLIFYDSVPENEASLEP